MRDEYMNIHTVQPISSLGQFLEIEKLWRELHAASSTQSIFLSFEYVHLWYTCFAKPEQVRIYPVFKENTLIGFLPLILRRRGPIRVLSSLINDHCLHAGPLILHGEEEAFYRGARSMLLSEKHKWDLFEYHGGYSFQDFIKHEELLVRDFPVIEQTFPTYTILLPTSFEEYFNHHISAKLRKNAKSERSKLKKVSSYNFRHYEEDMGKRHWPELLSVEDSGWKGKEGTSIKRLNREYQLYYEKLVELLARRKLLHLYVLEVDDRVIAGAFCYVDQDVFHYAKIGYDEAYATLSPSNLLLMFIIEDIIQTLPLVRRIHLFPGDYGYKHRYINEESSYTEYGIYSPTIPGKALYYSRKAKEMIKRAPGVMPAIEAVRQHLNGTGKQLT